MGFTRIEYDTWERREIFEYFRGTTMYMTVQVDITDFLARFGKAGLRFYPAAIYAAASVVNEHGEFRFGYDEEKKLGTWDAVHPFYTVPREGRPALFSMVATEYNSNFDVFYREFEKDYARAAHCGRLLCDGEERPDVMGFSIAPGLHFSSFAFGGNGEKPDLTPFVVFGKYEEKGGRVLLPVFGEFVHSVNDGHHISKFFGELQRRLDGFLAGDEA